VAPAAALLPPERLAVGAVRAALAALAVPAVARQGPVEARPR
jgi:hypothetical protein